MVNMSDVEKAVKNGKVEALEDKAGDLTPVISVGNGEIASKEDREDGQLQRSFTTHQVHIISLGSNIGSGLFIGSGAAFAAGGPGNVVLAYSLICSCVWAVLQTLSEMTIAFPVSGNFIDYADRFVDPALAFAAGLAEWLAWVAIVGSEAAFFNIFIQFWAQDHFPQAASMSIFLVACFVIFTLPNKVFAWFEYVTSLIKVVIFLIIILLSLAIVCGAGPAGYVHDGVSWRTTPVFKNGFSGFANATILAVWAVADQVFIGILAGEAHNPRLSLGRATKVVPARVGFVYLSCIVFITLLVSPDDSSLLGGSGITASPFVIAVQEVRIPVIANILNAGIMVGVLAIGAEAVYVSSRMLRTLAHQRLIPGFVAKVDGKGRPFVSLGITCAFAVLLTYLNLSAGGKEALTYLIQMTATSYALNWLIISVTSWRFRAALAAQHDPLFTEPYAWSMSPRSPLPSVWLFLASCVPIVGCFVVGVIPPGAALSDFSAANFFKYTLGVWIVGGLTVLYKIGMRTKLRDVKTVDLKTGRRVLTGEEMEELRAYYALPGWRRALLYFKVW